MRFMKVVMIVALMLLAVCLGIVRGGPKKIKVYLDAPNKIGLNETMSLQLMEQMRLADEADDSFEFVWIKKAIDADYIITMVSERNKLPVLVRSEPNNYDTCKQFLVTIVLDRMIDIKFSYDTPSGMAVVSRRGIDPDYTHYMINQQLDCDPDEIARKAAIELMRAMKLKPQLANNK